ncbi:MAG TPA: hypothetical protein VN456_04870 [Desulfosporosinus sp.]|nr:hypothetical protein [Desulfosporosinus sp.]
MTLEKEVPVIQEEAHQNISINTGEAYFFFNDPRNYKFGSYTVYSMLHGKSSLEGSLMATVCRYVQTG